MLLKRLQHELVLSVENDEESVNKLLKFSARNVVTGKFEPVLTVIGEKEELVNLVNRLRKRIEAIEE